MVFTEVGMVMEEREVQEEKALSLMVFTEVGMVMEEREVQP
jgi:hypothetical protein